MDKITDRLSSGIIQVEKYGLYKYIHYDVFRKIKIPNFVSVKITAESDKRYFIELLAPMPKKSIGAKLKVLRKNVVVKRTINEG